MAVSVELCEEPHKKSVGFGNCHGGVVAVRATVPAPAASAPLPRSHRGWEGDDRGRGDRRRRRDLERADVGGAFFRRVDVGNGGCVCGDVVELIGCLHGGVRRLCKGGGWVIGGASRGSRRGWSDRFVPRRKWGGLRQTLACGVTR